MADAPAKPLADASDDDLVSELFRRYPLAVVACGTHAGNYWHNQQGDAFALIGMMEHTKHVILRPTLDEIV